MESSRASLLQAMPIFGAVDASALDFLLDRATPVSVPGQRLFFEQGDLGRSMFVIEQGRVGIQLAKDGATQQLAELGPGDCFGEMALVECSERSASARALEACKAIEIDFDTLHALYEHAPDQFLLIHMNIAREISRRLRRAGELLCRMRSDLESLQQLYELFV